MKLSLSQTFLPLVIKCIEGNNKNNNKASIRSIWMGHLHDDIFLLLRPEFLSYLNVVIHWRSFKYQKPYFAQKSKTLRDLSGVRWRHRANGLLLVLSFAQRAFSLGTPVFPPLFKYQQFQIPIRIGIRYTNNHVVDVLPLNRYFTIVLFYLCLFKWPISDTCCHNRRSKLPQFLS